VPTLEALKITQENVSDFIYRFYGCRVDVTCVNGAIFTAKVGWFAEDMGEDDNELGVCFDDATDVDGNTIPGYCMEISLILSVTPLENENTEEKLKILFG
jgi:hypothetical protein